MEFRGGVNDAYFVGAKVEVFDNEDNGYIGTVISLLSPSEAVQTSNRET